jgi:hypothetical protein
MSWTNIELDDALVLRASGGTQNSEIDRVGMCEPIAAAIITLEAQSWR